MESFDESLQHIKEQLQDSSKEKLLCLSTTANHNNPNIYFGSLRETATTIAGNIIVRDLEGVEKIIEMFDGVVTYFLIDCEVKNEVADLESFVIQKIKKSKYLVYKPNDFTVESLDMFIAGKRGSIQNQNIGIVGFGNIGAKIALRLCERGAEVFGYERNQEKLKIVIDGLNIVKRSRSQITAVSDLSVIPEKIDILIGATPGTAVIDEKIVAMVTPDGMIIDVGNGTLTPEGIALAHERKIVIYSLSSAGGYVGMIENWLFHRNILAQSAKKEYDGFVLIRPGILGAYGEILVDDVQNPSRIIGVCNGQGDLMSKDNAKEYLQKKEGSIENKTWIHKIQQLYF